MAAHGQQPETDLFAPVVPPKRREPGFTTRTPEPTPPPRPPRPPRPAADPSERSARSRIALARLAVIVLAALGVWRIATAGITAAATAQEGRLAEGAYAILHLPAASTSALAAGDLGQVAARFQLTCYAWITGAFDRHDSVVGAGRELAVLAACATIGALLVLAHRCGIRRDAVAVPLAVLVMIPPAVTELARFGPGVLGVAWTAVGLAAALGRGRGRGVRVGVGAGAVVVGILTAPLLAVPLTVTVVLATARRWAPVAAVAASLGSAVLVLQILTSVDATDGPDPAGRPILLLVVGTGVVVVAAAAVRGLRAVAVGAAAALLVVMLPWEPSSTLLPGVIVVAVTLLGALASTAATRAVEERPWVARAGEPVPALGALLVAVIVTGLAAFTTSRPPAAHLALAAWITSDSAPDATFDAPRDVRVELIRDGVPADRIITGGTLVVAAAGAGAGADGADFGDGLTVSSRTPAAPVATDETAARATAGAELAANPNLIAPASVRRALADGSVDPRALVLLAALTGRGPVHVDAVAPVAGESSRLPLHQVRVSGLDAATRTFLAAQQSPFAPLVSPDATTLTWPVPFDATLLGP